MHPRKGDPEKILTHYESIALAHQPRLKTFTYYDSEGVEWHLYTRDDRGQPIQDGLQGLGLGMHPEVLPNFRNFFLAVMEDIVPNSYAQFQEQMEQIRRACR